MLSHKKSKPLRAISIIGLLMITAELWIGNYVAAQSEQEKDIVKAFNKTVSDYIPTHTAKYPRVLKVGAGWIKQYYEPDPDYSVDVRKTDSLVSPYLGIVEFNVIRKFSGPHKTQKEAEKDDTFKSDPFIATHKYTFAFQDGAWILKSRELRFGTSELSPCNPPDGCL